MNDPIKLNKTILFLKHYFVWWFHKTHLLPSNTNYYHDWHKVTTFLLN